MEANMSKKKYIITAHDEYEMVDLVTDVGDYLDGVSLHAGQKCKITIEILDDDELIDDGDLDDFLDDEEDEEEDYL
jgi:hypothetical protein